ncbi:hypothetical protein [Rhodococcus sp. LB1]|nr:hypothetical protein [Rhodococcus sp. LB1]
MRDWPSPQRSLVFVDVPVIGRPPLRVWMDILLAWTRATWGN